MLFSAISGVLILEIDLDRDLGILQPTLLAYYNYQVMPHNHNLHKSEKAKPQRLRIGFCPILNFRGCKGTYLEYIPEKNHINVVFMINHLHNLDI